MMKKHMRPAILMLAMCLTLTLPALAADEGAALADRYPAEFAGFDADAWFQGRYGDAQGLTMAQYMAREGQRTYEVFRRDMFAQWAAGEGFRFGTDAPVVTVDGVPVPFEEQLYDGACMPVVAEGAVLVPLPAMEKALELETVREGEPLTVTCTRGNRSVRFTMGAAAYEVTADGATRVETMESPFPTEMPNAVYLPLRPLAEALGCTVAWTGGPFRTAAVTTPADYARADYDPPLWQQPVFPGDDYCYASLEDFMESNRLDTEEDYYAYVADQMAADADAAAYAADRAAWYAKFQTDHAEEIAAFDADAYFETEYPCKSCGDSKEDYLAQWDLSEADFQSEMKNRWIWDQYVPTQVFHHSQDRYLETHPELAEAFDPLAWYLGQNDPWRRITCDYVPEAWPPAEMTPEDERFYYAVLDEEIWRRKQIESDRWDWEHLLKTRPDVAEAFLVDMEHPEHEPETQFYSYLTPQEYLDAHPGETLEQAYWGVYYDHWSGCRYTVMAEYWDFRAEHPGWCTDVAVTVNGAPLYIPYGNTAFSIQNVTYVRASALSEALGREVGDGEHGFVPLRTAAEALGCEVAWDGASGAVSITGGRG